MVDGVRLLTVLRVARRHCRITEAQEVLYLFIYFTAWEAYSSLKKKKKFRLDID